MNLGTAAKQSWRRCPPQSGGHVLTAQKAAREERLHISATVGDQVDHDSLVEYPIYDSVGLKENLAAVFAKSWRSQFFRS